MKPIEKAKQFVYRNARPLDLALWQYHFENGSKEAVLDRLAAYQNPDGGFGHALEPDNFCPESAPLQTWKAIGVLREIDMTDGTHPIIQGILRYLESGKDFDREKRQWLNCVPSTNHYPHAIWWEYQEGEDLFIYNPTASLAGWIIRFAPKESALYEMGVSLVREAVSFLCEEKPLEEMHALRCFIELYEDCSRVSADWIDMDAFRRRLEMLIRKNICADDSKWMTEYVAKPSVLINSRQSLCYEEYAEAIQKECDEILRTQLPDGSFVITFNWCTDYRESVIAENWWKSDIIMKNMLLLREFGRLDEADGNDR